MNCRSGLNRARSLRSSPCAEFRSAEWDWLVVQPSQVRCLGDTGVVGHPTEPSSVP
jgi:hypothetical protein